MKIFLIADNTETFTGMRLAGIDGIIVHTEDEFNRAFEQALKDENTGVILIMDSLYSAYSERIMERKLNSPLPLIVSVPERNCSSAITKAVSDYIETAIGMKL